jgi:hypothetical protein
VTNKSNAADESAKRLLKEYVDAHLDEEARRAVARNDQRDLDGCCREEAPRALVFRQMTNNVGGFDSGHEPRRGLGIAAATASEHLKERLYEANPNRINTVITALSRPAQLR